MFTEAPPPAAALSTTSAGTPEQTTATPSPVGLPLHLLAEPLRGQVDWVQRRHGLTPAAATLATLAIVLCACGPSCRISNPIDTRSLPPAMSVVLYGHPSAYFQAAIEVSLDSVRQWMLQRIGPPDKRQLRRARLRLGELHQQRVAKEFQINSPGAAPQAPGSDWGGALAGKELEAHQRTLQDEHARIVRQINDVTFLLRPHLLADDTALVRLLDPGGLCTDGAVFHASLDGHAIAAWSGASAATKAELARLLHLSWHGLPDAGDEDCHVQPLLSNVVVTDPAGASSLRSDRCLVAAGAIRHLFFVKANDGEAKTALSVEWASETAKRWTGGLQVLLDARLAGHTVEYNLDDTAVAVFTAFDRELLAEAITLEPEKARRLERTPVFALKLALLVHAISPNREDRIIGADTVEFACALASAVSTQDLRFTHPEKPGTATAGAVPGDHALAALIGRLRLRGALRWRDLLRSQRVQKAEPLEKLLAQALSAGLVRKEGDLYHAVDLDRKP